MFLVVLVIARGMLQNISWITAVTGESTSVRFTVILLSIFGWMGVARLVRGQVKQLKEREFIEAARALGASTRRIMFRHLVPNTMAPLIIGHRGAPGYRPEHTRGSYELAIEMGVDAVELITKLNDSMKRTYLCGPVSRFAI